MGVTEEMENDAHGRAAEKVPFNPTETSKNESDGPKSPLFHTKRYKNSFEGKGAEPRPKVIFKAYWEK